tara:strand:- start:7460 stop:8287 length:828 start_codon:yes stop_codon:yes gene_type:complete
MQEERVEIFFYWIYERTRIQEKKDRGDPWPWTHDPILKEYKFTNAFRERDKTTVWFRENIRDRLAWQPEVYMATVIFRWFNLIETGKTLIAHNLHIDWDPEKAYDKIVRQDKWITGAYMIKSPNNMNKVRGLCNTITTVWDDRERFLDKCPWQTLEGMNSWLSSYPYLGPFLAYELATDFRHTFIGRNASDILTWANAGPGAMRGLNRIYGRDLNYRSKSHDWCSEMRELLEIAWKKHSLDFELREIEHSLCEFDKYERVRLKQGAPRSKYVYKK